MKTSTASETASGRYECIWLTAASWACAPGPDIAQLVQRDSAHGEQTYPANEPTPRPHHWQPYRILAVCGKKR